ncbi:hypothetical protein AYR62_12095 [Secundilactobacillus paracollinoides]|uniref:Bacteriocin n=2 Tax=Secundilactobacillus paracollinoides TaxID=240427 RepID=A0A1B2IXJ9_9LACO|nr:hypothetical protein AYR61_05760 [Secundilactobacillus paracollinoides]ANZ64746.1 hypothetical protein AYR62_12095 [Secundilactobacillus paracollinoides]ANZ66750.1 hypothetical protein AYR63_06130 [Secundilactobacillus paracollinoides]
MKKSLVKVALGVALLTVGGTVANASVSETANQDIHSGQAYASDTAVVNRSSEGSKIIVGGKDSLGKMTTHPLGGTFNYGVHGLLKFSQFADFKCNRTHRATAMMNKHYTKTGWEAKNTWAKAETPSYWSYSSNNSYYDYK